MILRCAIVDDEPLALGLLESYVNKTPFLQLTGKYSSAVQAMKELPGEEVDLLFLDIHLVTKGRALLFHLAHRSLSLSVFVEIADGFVGKLFCILQYLVGFLICLA